MKDLCRCASLALLFAALGCQPKPQTVGPNTDVGRDAGGGQPTGQSATAPKTVEIDLDKAVEVALPNITQNLVPVAFKTRDGREGWAVRIPGNRPIATPTFYEGRLYVGGGYGSYEFYAFDARSGNVAWQIRVADDGPTAAVAEDGLVAFNTESCTVITVEAKTGKVVWQEWLGDPLMSQPTISKGRLYIAYPGGQRGSGKAGYRMLCADLKTGRHIWEQAITGDVISAPVADDDRLFFTCFDGTSFCLKAGDGDMVWKKANAGTSAPIVADGQVVLTLKEERDGKAREGVIRLDPKGGEAKDKELLVQESAEYVSKGHGGASKFAPQAAAKMDSGVGNSGADLKQLGMSSVVSGWSFEGSRAVYHGGQIMNAQGNYLNCLSSRSGAVAWRGRVKGKGVTAETQVFSPPAIGGGSLYLCGVQGHLISVGQKEGEVRFLYALNHPMVFQPALANGCMYVGTADGLLICLKTGDRECDGWTMWGGNAQHNKKD